MTLCRLLIAASSLALIISPLAASNNGRKSVNTLVYHRVARTLCWLEKPVAKPLPEADIDMIRRGTTACPSELRWDPGHDFFRSGDVVRVVIVRGRFFSVFTVTAKDVQIASEDPGIRGIPDAPLTFGSGAAPAVETKAMLSLSTLENLVLKEWNNLKEDLQKLATDTDAPSKQVPPYTDRAQFDDFTSRADAVIARIKELNPVLCQIAAKQGPEALVHPGDGEPNFLLALVFTRLNRMWRNSQTVGEFTVLHLGQWSGSDNVSFEIAEESRYRPYDYAKDSAPACEEKPGKPAGQDTGDDVKLPPMKSDAKKTAPAPKNAAAPKKKKEKPKGDKPAGDKPEGDTPAPDPAPADTPAKGVVIYNSTFDVHEIRRGNVVSGFMASTLRNREYGISKIRANGDDGKPLSDTNGPVFIRVPEIGLAKRPQMHYFVGIDFYFRPRDFFPGASSWITPSMLFGYGVNDPFNFMFGPNFETRIGINFGVGLHLGREKFLATGLVAGPSGTRLADATTAADTIDRFSKGIYVNVGFDLKTMKNVFGGLIGLK